MIHVKKQEEKQIIIAFHVNDFYTFANCKNEIENLKKEIAKVFKIKDLGKIKECLEMRISRDRKKEIITLDQENYTKDVLRYLKW